LDYSSSFSITNDKYIDTDSDGDSYGTEPTVFDGNTDSNADNNADCDANSSINYNDAYKAPA
jgi:hypothetical protein